MKMSPEIVNALSEYLRGASDLQSFRDWMVKARHELYDRMSDDDRKLLAEAEGRYAELSDGFIGEQEFKRLLDPYLVPVVQQLPKAKAAGAVASVLTSSNSSSNVAARYGSTDDWNQRNYVFNLPRELTLSHSS